MLSVGMDAHIDPDTIKEAIEAGISVKEFQRIIEDERKAIGMAKNDRGRASGQDEGSGQVDP